jgi:hypothetical protein
LHADSTRQSIALELVQELICQRLSHGFQICTIATTALGSGNGFIGEESKTISQILQDIDEGDPTAIYLSLANQIHRINYDRTTESVLVKISKKRRTWTKRSLDYACLISTPSTLPDSSSSSTQPTSRYRQTRHGFHYPNLIESEDWEHLDSIVAGLEEPDLRSTLRYWRTRFVVLPAEGGVTDKEFLVNNAKGVTSSSTAEEINLAGFSVLMDILQACRWTAPGFSRDPTPTEMYAFVPTILTRSLIFPRIALH